MRCFVRQSFKCGRCGSFNQYHKSTISDEVFNNTSKEIGVIGKLCEILDKDFEYRNKHGKILEDEYDSQFDDFRDISREVKEKYVNGKHNFLRIHEKLQKVNLNDLIMNFDATLL